MAARKINDQPHKRVISEAFADVRFHFEEMKPIKAMAASSINTMALHCQRV